MLSVHSLKLSPRTTTGIRHRLQFNAAAESPWRQQQQQRVAKALERNCAARPGKTALGLQEAGPIFCVEKSLLAITCAVVPKPFDLGIVTQSKLLLIFFMATRHPAKMAKCRDCNFISLNTTVRAHLLSAIYDVCDAFGRINIGARTTVHVNSRLVLSMAEQLSN